MIHYLLLIHCSRAPHIHCKQYTDAVKSDPVIAVTMDTTTQNFTFETVEFGDGFSSSYFNDVWIFDENNIWAVGYVYPE
jgi:hypothetical protein